MIPCSRKLSRLPPYLFSKIRVLTQEAYARKLDVIDLGMGNPDLPTPLPIVERLIDTIKHHPQTHRYPQAKGMPKFRRVVAEHMSQRFGVRLDPEKEILALIGSKEGIAHLAAAYLNPGDIALVPEPTYPVHFNGVILAGGEVHFFPLKPENGYIPDLTKIPQKALQRAKLLYLNYPNNPTTAVIKDKSFFREVVRFAKKYKILVVYDNAYSEVTFDDYVAPSFLETPGAKDVAVEFHSFSKTFNMAGWRLGWACGNSQYLGALEKFKSFVDYGVPTFTQLAGIAALTEGHSYIRETVETYRRRRDYFCAGLDKIGWHVEKPLATMYVWAKLPPKLKMDSMEFAESLIRETGVAVAPGTGFGSAFRNYVRFALVTHDQRFHDVLLRLKHFFRQRGLYPKKTGRGGKNKVKIG